MTARLYSLHTIPGFLPLTLTGQRHIVCLHIHVRGCEGHRNYVMGAFFGQEISGSEPGNTVFAPVVRSPWLRLRATCARCTLLAKMGRALNGNLCYLARRAARGKRTGKTNKNKKRKMEKMEEQNRKFPRILEEEKPKLEAHMLFIKVPLKCFSQCVFQCDDG